MKKTIYLLILLTFISSCLKTTEEIKKEKHLEAQLAQGQEFDKDFLIQVQQLQTSVDSYQGRFEEVEHKQFQGKQDTDDKMQAFITQSNEQLKALKEIAESNQKSLSSLKAQVEKQNKFIKKVTSSLGSMGTSSKKKSSKGALGELEKANKLFSKKKYKQAKKIYANLIDNKKLKASKNNIALLKLGIIEYNNKKYDDALVLLSQIYTKWPRSSRSPSALYHIALCFKAKGLKDESRETFNKVVKQYSKSSYASKAKKQLKSL